MATIAAVTIWRILCYGLTPLDLFMDEAQYWHWGQDLALGYFSKPPLIGWAIRAATELSGSETAFWVRLVAALGHAIAAVCVGLAARHVWQRPDAVWAGAAYVTLPGVAVLSLFVSTDDLLLPAFAAALLAYVKLRDAPRSLGWTLGLGVAIGLGLLAKYAMIYFLAGLALALVMNRDPALRRAVIIACLLGLLLSAPNLVWNATQGFVTFSHTAENAGWEGMVWNWSGAAEFLGTQIVALNPVFAVALVPAVLIGIRQGMGLLVLLSVGIFAAVALQALIRMANGNWAAPAFVAATILAVPWCMQHWPRAAKVGLALNLLLAVLIPALTLAPDTIQLRGKSVFTRIMAPVEFGAEVIAAAENEKVAAIVSDDRMLLATLAWQLRQSDLSVYSVPPDGPPRSHYEMTMAVTGNVAPAFLALHEMPENCPVDMRQLPDPSRWEKQRNLAAIRLAVTQDACWP